MQTANFRTESGGESTAGSRYLRDLIQTKQLQQQQAYPKLFNDEEMEKLQSQYLAIENKVYGRQTLNSDTALAKNKNFLNTLICGDFDGSASKKKKNVNEEDDGFLYAGAMTRVNRKMINDNVQLAQRLVNQPGTLPKKKWEQSYKDHCRYSALRSRFKYISPHARLVNSQQNSQFSESFNRNNNNNLSPSSPLKSSNLFIDPDTRKFSLTKKHTEIDNLAPLFSSPNNFYGQPLKEFNSPLIAETVKNILSPEEDFNLSQQFHRQGRSFSSGNNGNNMSDLNRRFSNKNNGQLSFNSSLGMKVNELKINSTSKNFYSSQFQFSFSQNGGQKQHSQVFVFSQLTTLKFSVYLDGLNSVECCLVQITDKGTAKLGKMFLDVAGDKKEEIKEVEVPIYSMDEGITNPIGSAQLVLRLQPLSSSPHTIRNANNEDSFLPSLRQKKNSPTIFAEKEKLGSSANFQYDSPFADSFERMVFQEGKQKSPGKSHSTARNQLQFSNEYGSSDKHYENSQLEPLGNELKNTNRGVLDMQDFFETIAVSQSHKGNLAKRQALKNRIGQLKNDSDTIPSRNRTFEDATTATPNPLKNSRLRMSDLQQKQQQQQYYQQQTQKQYEQNYYTGNDFLSFGGY